MSDVFTAAFFERESNQKWNNGLRKRSRHQHACVWRAINHRCHPLGELGTARAAKLSFKKWVNLSDFFS